MIVLYRISDAISQHRPPFKFEDKEELALTCLRSFRAAVGNTPIERFFIISDGAEEWKQAVVNIMDPFEVWWFEVGGGNLATFQKQLELAQLFDERMILFCEDDYLWRPNSLETLHEAMGALDLIFPYDHPAHYTDHRFGQLKKMELIKGHTYRKSLSNTLTFATTDDFIRTYIDIFNANGVLDHEIFSAISESEELWCPTHSFATHMVEGLLAPNVNWEEFANLYR